MGCGADVGHTQHPVDKLDKLDKPRQINHPQKTRHGAGLVVSVEWSNQRTVTHMLALTRYGTINGADCSSK